VVFQLHPSFAQPTRELNEPPFEVTETGWGEFEASIRIIWNDVAGERSTILTHGIRLYPNKAPSTSADTSAYMNTQVPVVAEKYDEVVFTNPREEFHQCLINGHKKNTLAYPLSNEQSVLQHYRTYGDEGDVKALLSAKQFLEGELRNVKDRLLRVDSELDEVKCSLTATAAAGREAGDVPTGERETFRRNNGKEEPSWKARKKLKKKLTAPELQIPGKKAKKGC